MINSAPFKARAYASHSLRTVILDFAGTDPADATNFLPLSRGLVLVRPTIIRRPV
jgi:hypothetical protein